MPKVTLVPLSDLTPDNQNANKHTVRGSHLLRTSIEQFGPSRDAIVLDRHGKIVGGNARSEVFADKQMDEVQVIEGLDCTKPVALKFDDLDLSDENNPARFLSVALNRTAQVNIDFDFEVLANYKKQGIELDDFFFESELQKGLEDAGNEYLGDEDGNGDENENLTTCPHCGAKF